MRTLGIPHSSRKENERRLPLHPGMLDEVPRKLRENVVLEAGYGEQFGVPDEDLLELGYRLGTRSAVVSESEVVLIPKPDLRDLQEMQAGATFWGWPHCVQGPEITQIAIDKKLTVVAFEDMHDWSAGRRGRHVFHANNQLAGYSSVFHALQLQGDTGHYGPAKRAAIIGFGATGEGALEALLAHNIDDVDILSRRPANELPPMPEGVRPLLLKTDNSGELVVVEDGEEQRLNRFLQGEDIIVNCTLQDPNDPLLFLADDDLPSLRPGSLIIDVSCDEGMGFEWAKPTSLEEPIFLPASGVTYYAVDHSPTVYWRAATWENSRALLPFLEAVITGEGDPQVRETLDRAVELDEGRVVNPAILEFQNRGPHYPHPIE